MRFYALLCGFLCITFVFAEINNEEDASITTTDITTAEVATTAEPTTTAEVATTAEPTTTTLPTTTPEVWAEFDLDCDSENGTCIYKLIVPQVDSLFENQTNSFNQEKSDYLNASQETYQANRDFINSTGFSNFSSLVDLYNEIQNAYENLTVKVATALNDSSTVKTNLDNAWDRLYAIGSGLFPNNPEGCYAQKCANMVPPTTTTTKAPTTTAPSLCSKVTCKTFADYKGTCSIINNKAVCQCPGDLDQNNNCGPASCYSSTVIGLPSGTVPGPVWSVGYNRTNSATANYGSNRNCYYSIVWNTTLQINVNTFNLDPTAVLKINSRTVPTTNTKAFLDYYFNELNKTKAFTFIFTSGNVDKTGNFVYDFDVTVHK